ncbi:MAG: T9SS type A sorting domain-containing protein, partial [Bacteroidales bacterium]
FSKIVKRPSKGGFTTYSFDSIILDTASYYIYARQITDFKIQLMRDNTPSFYYKLNEENGKIIKQNSAGSLVLRANFGHKAKEVNIQADISVYEILKPADSGIFTTAENIEVTLVNYSEINISNVDVYCLVNGQKQQKTVNCEASAATNISFKADLSVVGTYTIQVFTTFENDLDKSNDTLLKIVKCIAKEAEKDTTGIESWTATTISIYPNPAKEVLYLESKGSKIQKIGVYSIGGIECLLIKINREEYTLNTSFLKPGLYLLRLKTDRGESIKKFIIK